VTSRKYLPAKSRLPSTAEVVLVVYAARPVTVEIVGGMLSFFLVVLVDGEADEEQVGVRGIEGEDGTWLSEHVLN
jgi:hypothetical protein